MKLNLFIPALLCGLLFFSVFASASLVDNYGFEDESYTSTHYCCKNILLMGACEHHEDPFRHPDIWNSYAQNRDFIRSVDVSHSGDWAVKIWSQEANNCTFISLPSTCGQENITVSGDLSQDVYPDNTSLELSFWARKCPEDERPDKCTAFWLETEYYGDGDLLMEGKYYVAMQFNYSDASEETLTLYGDASSTWGETSIDVSQSDINHTANLTSVRITIGNRVIDSFDTQQYCVIFDDVNLSYAPEPVDLYENVSSAINYMEDMHTFWGLPSTVNYTFGYDTTCDGVSPDGTISDIILTTYNFQTSKGFSKVPYGNIRFYPACVGCGSHQSVWYSVSCNSLAGIGKTGRYGRRPYVVLHYDNGSSIDVSDQTFMMNEMSSVTSIHKCPTGNVGVSAPMNVRFPMYDWEDIDHVHMNITMIYEYVPNSALAECGWVAMNVSYDSDLLKTRQIYTDPMADSYETITGIDNIFPFMAIKGNFDEENITFCGWTFSDDTIAYSLNNAEFWLYDSNDVFKNVITESISVDGGNNIYTIYDNHGNARWCHHIDYCTGFDVDISTLDCFEFSFMQPEDGDKAHIIMKSDPAEHSNVSSDTKTAWVVGEEIGVGFCEDYCLGLNYHDGTLDEHGVCTYVVYVNDTRCQEEAPPSEWEEGASELLEPFANATQEAGAYISETWNILDMSFDMLTKLIIAILVSMGIGVSVMKKTENSQYNHIIGLLGIVGGFLFFTVFGWMPIWIGIIMTILAGFLLVRGIVSVFIG